MDGFFKDDLLERLARLDEDAALLFDDDAGSEWSSLVAAR